jgi:hypothetical protein
MRWLSNTWVTHYRDRMETKDPEFVAENLIVGKNLLHLLL